MRGNSDNYGALFGLGLLAVLALCPPLGVLIWLIIILAN